MGRKGLWRDKDCGGEDWGIAGEDEILRKWKVWDNKRDNLANFVCNDKGKRVWKGRG